jgi:hypothetical protein
MGILVILVGVWLMSEGHSFEGALVIGVGIVLM